MKVPLDSAASLSPASAAIASLGIGGEPARLLDLLTVEDILAQRLRQGLAPVGQRQIIGRGAAIKGLAEGLHALGHFEVADAQFAQIIVHIVAKMVEQRLRQLLARLDRFQPPQDQP